MKIPLISTPEVILLAGGGAFEASDLRLAQGWATKAVAADGGADTLLRYGVVPMAVIGDFDSLAAKTRASLAADTLHHIAEQDSTDFDKCLRNIDSPLILGLGFLGARVDHQLAVFNRLVARADTACILIGPCDVVFHCPPQLTIALAPDQRFSLFPMARVTGRSTGLRWPIDGVAFSPHDRVGTSNRTTQGEVKLTFDAPGMLAILPRDFLAAAIKAVLSAGPVPWRLPEKR